MFRKRAVSFFFFVLLAVSGAQRSGWAQVTVMGRVSDSTGVVIPGVPLSLARVNGAYSQQAVSDDSGQFRMIAVPPGR